MGIIQNLTGLFFRNGLAVCALFFSILVNSGGAYAQWSDDLFGNEWIDYSKQYIRLQITETGIQRLNTIDLPAQFSKSSPDRFQLWHRGKEVGIIRANTTEIIFYGDVNDGASDSLMYRPRTARLNPYTNLFSDKGVYFLTLADNPLRVQQVDGGELSGEIEPFHLQQEVKTYSDQFAFTTYSMGTSLNNSFYESVNMHTSPTVVGINSIIPTLFEDTVFNADVKLHNWVKGATIKPRMELALAGLYTAGHRVQISVSSNKNNYRVADEFVFSGWTGKKGSFELEPDDISSSGDLYMKLVSKTDWDLDFYGVSYYALTYPQLVEMGSQPMAIFSFPKTKEMKSRIRIANVASDVEVFNITQTGQIQKIKGTISSDKSWEGMVSRKSGQELKLIAVSSAGINQLEKAHVSETRMKPIYNYLEKSDVMNGPVATDKYDYIIITNSTLSESATKYAQYRDSEEGGGNRTLVMDIRDIYDLYNYGEPSPIAIRSFMRYMLKEGLRIDKHNLFLIGKSVTRPEYIKKELEGEVPTFGDPGSDLLLVSGIAGAHQDVPAIPIGRLRAFTNDEVESYLEKVKSYESEKQNIGWRKNVLHLSGGHSTLEIQQLRGIMSRLTPLVENSELSGSVKPIVKTINTVEKIDISPEINRGVGMMSFFGHGAQTITDLDFGYASDINRGFNNKNRYPFIYFNGCGVGNIFSTGNTHILSDDWIITPNKGAIAIMANSYKSYISSSERHINTVYQVMFENEMNFPIGRVLQETCARIVESNPNSYDIANLHQVCLQGDPALKLVRVDDVDYVVDAEDGIYVFPEQDGKTIGDADRIKIAVVISNAGKYKQDEEIPIHITISKRNGEMEGIVRTMKSMRLSDTLWVAMDKSEEVELIEVNIDPEKKLEEFTRHNNVADLIIDWDVAREASYYPMETLRDIVEPRVKVTFDNMEVANRAKILVNSKIHFLLEDDRVLSENLELIEVYLKKCWDNSCEFDKLDLSNSKLYSTSNREIAIEYDKKLEVGEYEILLIGYDKLGNTTSNGYRRLFSVISQEETEQKLPKVVVSPNPANRFAHFAIEVGSEVDTIVSCYVYNSMGTVQMKRDLQDSNTREWYWTGLEHLSSGMYFYRIHFQKSDGSMGEIGGTIIIAN